MYRLATCFWVSLRTLSPQGLSIAPKNVKIADNSIVGWGSIVTKEFNEPNVIIAGIPAKIVKRGINWDRRCINKYLKERL